MTNMTGSHQRWWMLLFLVIFPLYLTWTFDHSLWNPDETRDAGIAREMFVTKDFVVPHLNAEAFLEKPPLYYWSCAAVYKVAGEITDGLTRLPAALYGFLGVLFTFLIGRRLMNDRAGFMAAAILATGGQYFRMSHFALMDSSLAALITGALYFYLTPNIVLFSIFVTLAFYTKGFVAVALTGIVIGTDLLLKKDFKRLALITVIGSLVFAVLTAPWIYKLWQAGGADHFRVFFIDNNWNRFFSGKADHAAPFYFYLGAFPADFLPWTFFFLPAFVSSFPRRRSPLANRHTGGAWAPASAGVTYFPKIWFLSIFVFLSLSSGKRSMYLLPAFPAAALLTAAWLDQHRLGWKLFKSVFVTLIALIVIGDIFFVKRLDRDKTFLPVVDAIKTQRNGALLAGYDLSEFERGVFPFYLEETIPNIKSTSELNDYLLANKDKPMLLLANRNKQKDIDPIINGHLTVVYKYREDQKTRSYLIYQKR